MMSKIRLNQKTGELTEEVRVWDASLGNMQEAGWEAGDNGYGEQGFYSRFSEDGLTALLTRRQKQVVICLKEGLGRDEIALKLIMSEQAVHQIIPRIKQRLLQALKERGKSYGTRAN